MSQASRDFPVKFSPFHTVLQDGIDRLLEIVDPEEFEFIVNEEHLKSTLAEAVLISPIISERLKADPANHVFHFPTTVIESKQFSAFLDLIRNREEWKLSSENQAAFLSICNFLGNECLSLIFLQSISQTSEMNIEDCAAAFSSYSVNELRNLSKEILHSLLSSPSLTIECEDSLLQTLINLGPDYFEFWCYIEVSFLSTQGISQFVEIFPFEELTESHWKKIVDRLLDVCDETFLLKRCRKGHILNLSTILSDIPTPLKQFERKKWTLLYRGSRDGFGCSDFHSKCDGHSNTVTVILTTKGFIFGGFTPIAWDSALHGKLIFTAELSFQCEKATE
jgi:hypothetical protein